MILTKMSFQFHRKLWFMGILEVQSGNEWQCVASKFLLISNENIWTGWVGLRLLNIQCVRMGNNGSAIQGKTVESKTRKLTTEAKNTFKLANIKSIRLNFRPHH